MPWSPSQDAATVGASHQSDSFVETLAAASRGLTENTARGWVAHGGLVVRKYRDLDQFDLTGLRAGLSYETDSGRLQTSVGGYFDTVYIGGNRLERIAMVDAQMRGRLDAGRELRGRYQLARIAGGGGFEYLDGWQQRLSADAGFATPIRAKQASRQRSSRASPSPWRKKPTSQSRISSRI